MNQGTSLGSQVGRWILLAALAVALGALLLTIRPAGAQDDSATIEYAEGGTDPVATLSATDPEMDMVTWTVADGGTGTLDFKIGADNGVLEFLSSPDYEVPAGGDADDSNTYVATVTATDTADTPNTDTFTVTVKVTNEDEDGVVSWTVDPDGGGSLTANVPPAKPIMQFQVGATLVASVTDGDVMGESGNEAEKTVAALRANVATDPTWRWYRSPSKDAMGTMIDGANAATYSVSLDDVGMHLRAVAYYVITGNVDQETASFTSDYQVLGAAPADSAPEFQNGITRKVNEGDAGMDAGDPVTASKGHGALNYTLASSGDDNTKFKIDQKTGQITSGFDLDREGTSPATATAPGDCEDPDGTECTVNVTATDSAGQTATAAVTISLENVDDKPTFTERATGVTTGIASPMAVTRAEGMTALADTGSEEDVTYAATDPEGLKVNLSLMGRRRGQLQPQRNRGSLLQDGTRLREPDRREYGQCVRGDRAGLRRHDVR